MGVEVLGDPQLPLEPVLRILAGALGLEVRHQDGGERVAARFELGPAMFPVEQLGGLELPGKARPERVPGELVGPPLRVLVAEHHEGGHEMVVAVVDPIAVTEEPIGQLAVLGGLHLDVGEQVTLAAVAQVDLEDQVGALIAGLGFAGHLAQLAVELLGRSRPVDLGEARAGKSRAK